MNTSQIDSIILSAVGEHWTKVAMVIARVVDAMSRELPSGDECYEVISRRIEALVRHGRREKLEKANKKRKEKENPTNPI
jgi:hypothetical protein